MHSCSCINTSSPVTKLGCRQLSCARQLACLQAAPPRLITPMPGRANLAAFPVHQWHTTLTTLLGWLLQSAAAAPALRQVSAARAGLPFATEAVPLSREAVYTFACTGCHKHNPAPELTSAARPSRRACNRLTMDTQTRRQIPLLSSTLLPYSSRRILAACARQSGASGGSVEEGGLHFGNHPAPH